MILLTSILLIELSIITTAKCTELTYSVAEGNTYVGTSSQNHALTGAALAYQNIKCVSINGDSVVIFTPTCQTTVTSLQGSDGIAQTMFHNLKDDGSSSIQTMFGKTTTVYNDGRKKLFKVNFSKANPNRASFSFGQHMRSISSPDFPENLARIIFDVDTVTYLYYDGSVDMKPIACIGESEKQFLDMCKSNKPDPNQMSSGQENEFEGTSNRYDARQIERNQRLAAKEQVRRDRENLRRELDEARQQRDLERRARNRERQIRDQERQDRKQSQQIWNQQQTDHGPMQDMIFQQQSGEPGMYQTIIDRGGGRYDNINVM